MAGRNKAPKTPRDAKPLKVSSRKSAPVLVDVNSASTQAAASSREKPALPTLIGGWKNQPVLSYYLILVTTLLLFIIGFILVFSAST
ncbi:cell division protein FtsW, partial [Mobiluncus curtisii]|nr:cell division protein FtsW [Mobiluncus curtisii]